VNWAVRWGGLLACLALLALRVLAETRGLSLEVATRELRTAARLVGGQVTLSRVDEHRPHARMINMQAGASRLPTAAGSPPVHWTVLGTHEFSFDGPGVYGTEVLFPFWALLVAVGLPPAVGWLLHLRGQRAPFLCPSCGYDLSGLSVGTPCPECASQ
jgi:hypothetical protein